MLIVDPATGAMFSLPKTVSAELENSDALTISSLDSLSEEEKQLLVKLN